MSKSLRGPDGAIYDFDDSFSPEEIVQFMASKRGGGGMPGLRDMPLLPMMGAQSPRMGDLGGALPVAGGIAGGVLGGPLGAGVGAGAGELGRQGLAGEGFDPGAAALSGAMGGGMAAAPGLIGRALAPMAKYGPALAAGAQSIAKGIPIVNRIAPALRAGKAAMKAAPKPAPAPGPTATVAKKAGAKVAGKIAPAKAAKPPAAKPKAAPKPKPPADTKPIKVKGKPNAVRGANQRGAGGRALQSRAEALAKIRAQSPPAVPSAADADMAAMLQRSVELERVMDAQGIPEAARPLLRRGIQEMWGNP